MFQWIGYLEQGTATRSKPWKQNQTKPNQTKPNQTKQNKTKTKLGNKIRIYEWECVNPKWWRCWNSSVSAPGSAVNNGKRPSYSKLFPDLNGWMKTFSGEWWNLWWRAGTQEQALRNRKPRYVGECQWDVHLPSVTSFESFGSRCGDIENLIQ